MNSVVNGSAAHIAYLRKKNVWYTLKDGDWGDRSVWSSNGVRKYASPQPGDDVIVSHFITMSGTAFPNNTLVLTVNNLTVTGTLKYANGMNGRNLYVNGNLDALNGTIEMSLAASAGLYLHGASNLFGTLNTNSASLVVYHGWVDQTVTAPLTGSFAQLTIDNVKNLASATYGYNNLSVKTLGSDVACSALIVNQTQLDLSVYNLNMSGNLYAINNGVVAAIKRSSGNGSFSIAGFISGITQLDLGTTQLNVDGGINGGNGTITAAQVNLRANQALSTVVLDALVVIGSGVTVTATSPTFKKGVNGADSTAVLYTPPAGWITFTGPGYSPMSTGTWVQSGSVKYSFITDFTITKTSFVNLQIYALSTGLASGVKATLSGDVTVSGAISFYQGTLDLAGYGLTANGTAQQNIQTFAINNSGAPSTMVFKGLLSVHGLIMNAAGTTIEVQASITQQLTGDTSTITANLYFSTGLSQSSLIAGTIILTGNIRLGDGVVVTSATSYTVKGTLNGDGASSKWDNRGILSYQNAQQPMATGIFECNAAVNTVKYNLAGAQDMTPGTYRTLNLAGTGAKKLLGNIAIVTAYTLTAPATLNANGFSISGP